MFKFKDLTEAKLTFAQSLDAISFIYDIAMEADEAFDRLEKKGGYIGVSKALERYVPVDDFIVTPVLKGEVFRYVTEHENPGRGTHSRHRKMRIPASKAGLYLMRNDEFYMYGPLGNNAQVYYLG